MARRVLIQPVPLVAIALAALAAGCGGGADGEATPTGSATATVEMTATPPPDIRAEDLTQQPALRGFLASAGGEVDPSRVIYVDLTEDGVEEAVVPVSSGGEGGDLAVFVFGYRAGRLRELLRALPEGSRSIAVDVEAGQLVTTQGVYGPGDPLCCPSQLLRQYYRWDGSALVVEREEQEAAGP